MYSKDVLKKSVKIFSQNPYWKEYYETAPSDECKEMIAFDFSFSLYDSDGYFKDDEEFSEESEKLESRLGLADWKHLLKGAGNNPWRAKCNQKIKELEEKQGAYKEERGELK